MDCKICSEKIKLKELLMIPFRFRLVWTREHFSFKIAIPVCFYCMENGDVGN